jgi:uncharacterized protein
MARFLRYELRTTDVDGARRFYAQVLGERGPEVVRLPEAAAARGARPHWLGHLGVNDVEAAARAFAERGAMRLGPTRPSPGGGEVAILRDPGGAVVALATPPAQASRAEVIWHELDAADPAPTAEAYRAVFGWHLGEPLDLGPLGVHRPFAWGAGQASVGSLLDVAALRGVHPQWVFHLRVAALGTALAAVVASGGVVMAERTLPGGERIALCDDPQGAGFALREGAPGAAGGAGQP